MRKWRLLVGVVSLAQLLWGIMAFVECSRSVGAATEPTSGWVFSGLGLLGLLVLILPRCGIPVAIVQVLIAGYALSWLPIAILLLRASFGVLSPLPVFNPVVPLLILMQAVPTALLCLLSAIGSWQVARRRALVAIMTSRGPGR